MGATSHTRKDYRVIQELETILSRLTDLDSDVDDTKDKILEDIGIVDFYDHSRWRVYPQDVTVTPLLTAAGVANTFGNWAEIIPLNTIPFQFHVVGFCICQVSATTTYLIQVGYNIVNSDPGTNMEMGERRFRVASTPIAKQTELMEIHSQGVPAYSRVMARLKTASGNPDTANMNVVISRHVDVENEVTLWPTFPW